MSSTVSATEVERPRSVERPRATAGERRREQLTYWAYLLGERVINLLPRWVVLPLAAAAGNAAHDLTADKRAVVRGNVPPSCTCRSTIRASEGQRAGHSATTPSTSSTSCGSTR